METEHEQESWIPLIIVIVIIGLTIQWYNRPEQIETIEASVVETEPDYSVLPEIAPDPLPEVEEAYEEAHEDQGKADRGASVIHGENNQVEIDNSVHFHHYHTHVKIIQRESAPVVETKTVSKDVSTVRPYCNDRMADHYQTKSNWYRMIANQQRSH